VELMHKLDYNSLKQRHRAERHGYHPNLNLRVHRSLSWLQCAELQKDLDSRFIFLWIAFNAAYATEIDESLKLSERSSFCSFLEKLSSLDQENLLEELIWKEFPNSIRILLSNKFVFQPFWDFQNGKISESEWIDQFENAKFSAQTALGAGNTSVVLSIVLVRTYTLRNQIVHGGSTWRSSVNREQVKDCAALLGKLLPITISIMMSSKNTIWGDPCYPVISY